MSGQPNPNNSMQSLLQTAVGALNAIAGQMAQGQPLAPNPYPAQGQHIAPSPYPAQSGMPIAAPWKMPGFQQHQPANFQQFRDNLAAQGTIQQSGFAPAVGGYQQYGYPQAQGGYQQAGFAQPALSPEAVKFVTRSMGEDIREIKNFLTDKTTFRSKSKRVDTSCLSDDFFVTKPKENTHSLTDVSSNYEKLGKRGKKEYDLAMSKYQTMTVARREEIALMQGQAADEESESSSSGSDSGPAAKKSKPTPKTNQEIFQEMTKFHGKFTAAQNGLQWAKQMGLKLNKGRLTPEHLTNLAAHMNVFGLTYFLKKNGGHPFEPLTKDVMDTFTAFKVAHELGIDEAWDGDVKDCTFTPP